MKMADQDGSRPQGYREGQPKPPSARRGKIRAPGLTRQAVEAHQAAAPNHHFVLEAPDRLVVEGDPHRLREVLNNLLENAVRYSPEGGDIRVSAEVQEDQAVVRVTDRGVGLDPKD